MTGEISFALLALTGIAGQAPQERHHTLTGMIKTLPAFESKLLGNKRDILVYLPPNYDKEPNRRYPVLYLQDGQNVFDGYTSFIPGEEWKADEAAEALIGAELIEPIIMVAIPNAGAERANEYLPAYTGDKSGMMPPSGGKADVYGHMLTDELMPVINQSYRTKTGPDNTAIAGSSLGGILSLHLGLTRPEIFGNLGVFSPSLWWQDGRLIEDVRRLPNKLDEKIWVDIGTEESKTAAPDVLHLKDALTEKGWTPGKDLAVYVDGYAKHNERAWANRFPVFLMFLYGRH